MPLIANRGNGAQGTSGRDHIPYCLLKHALDLVMGLLMLVVLSPLLLVVALVVWLDSGMPVIYRQVRVGRFEKPFTIYKFRTMKTGTPVLSTADMQQQSCIPFTRVGQLLRKTNLDELPQLFNIIRGEMSFIGPRPALTTQDDVNSMRRQSGVDAIRPGLTGYAQATGRDDLDSTTKVARDAEYLHRMGLLFDLKILALTVAAVCTARGSK